MRLHCILLQYSKYQSPPHLCTYSHTAHTHAGMHTMSALKSLKNTKLVFIGTQADKSWGKSHRRPNQVTKLHVHVHSTHALIGEAWPYQPATTTTSHRSIGHMDSTDWLAGDRQHDILDSWMNLNLYLCEWSWSGKQSEGTRFVRIERLLTTLRTKGGQKLCRTHPNYVP